MFLITLVVETASFIFEITYHRKMRENPDIKEVISIFKIFRFGNDFDKISLRGDKTTIDNEREFNNEK